MTAFHVPRFVGFVVFFFLLLCRMGYPQQTQGASTQDAQGVVIDELLKQVQIGLAKAQTDLHNEGIPPLQSVTLDLTAEVQKDVGGKINLFIVSFGHKWEKSRSQEIEVTLKPPRPSKLIARGSSVSDELIKAIESAARGGTSGKKQQRCAAGRLCLKGGLEFRS